MMVYLIFNAGYIVTSGDEWMRSALSGVVPGTHAGAASARRIGSSCSCGAEVVACIAQLSTPGQKRRRLIPRSRPRVVGLPADPARNDRARTRAKIRRWRDPTRCRQRIAACHMRARTAEETDSGRIVLLYDALLQINSD